MLEGTSITARSEQSRPKASAGPGAESPAHTRAYCSENILGHDLEIDVTDASLAIPLRQEARAAAMNADSIQYALETDWPVGAAGFEPLHLEIRSAELHPASTGFSGYSARRPNVQRGSFIDSSLGRRPMRG